MLVLTRKIDETILLGDDIEITIVEIKGDKVQIGIKAPKNITILRKELYQEVSDENLKAQEITVDKLRGVKIEWNK